MNVLVTGIDGFVGSHLAEALLSDPKIQVCGATYGPCRPDNPALLQSGIRLLQVDITRREPRLMVGNLDPQRDFTDIRDVVRAYITLLQQPRKHAVYNGCSGHAVAIRSIVKRLCELGGVEVEIVVHPARQRRDEIPQ